MVETEPRPRRRYSWRAAILAGVILLGYVIAIGVDRTDVGPAQGQGFFSGPELPEAPRDRLRVATFNIHSGRDAGGRLDLELTARTLDGFDLAGLNEVRSGFPWGTTDQAELLGRKLGMSWLFAPAERRWWHDSFGNAMLSRCPVRGWERRPLVNTRGKGYRNMVLAEVVFGGRTVSVLATHVDRREDRRAQLEVVARSFLGLRPPAILMGDLNSTEADPVLRELLGASDVIDALAHVTSKDPSERIDWILVRGLAVLDAGVRNLGASDHPCVWAELTLSP